MSAGLVLGGVATSAEAIEPIQRIVGSPNEAAFKAADGSKPLTVRSKEDLAKYFDDDQVTDICKAVDFKKQFILVFAWRGSGRDELDFGVDEIYPEQVSFHITPGVTFDLRPHTHVFALRNNVKWSAK